MKIWANAKYLFMTETYGQIILYKATPITEQWGLLRMESMRYQRYVHPTRCSGPNPPYSCVRVTDTSSHVIVYGLNNVISNWNVARATKHVKATLILRKFLYVREYAWYQSSINLRLCPGPDLRWSKGNSSPYPHLRGINVSLPQLLFGVRSTLWLRCSYGESYVSRSTW